MCKIIAIANQKGGVAKTTTTINLGVGLSKVGKRVMLIDADPQGHLTMGLGFPKNLRVTLKTMMENIIMGLEFDPREAILHHEEGIDVIPSNKLLSGMDMSLFTVEDREKVLKEYLELLENDYDYILIDCMPSLGMMTINALSAADSVLIPVQPQYYIFPQTLLQLYPEQDVSFTPEKIFKDNSGLTIADVCAECNNGALSELDSYGGELIKKQFKDEIDYNMKDAVIEKTIEYDLFAKWILKIAYNYFRSRKIECSFMEEYIPCILQNVELSDNFDIFMGLHINTTPVLEEVYNYQPLQICENPKLRGTSIGIEFLFKLPHNFNSITIPENESTLAIRFGNAVMYVIFWKKDCPVELKKQYKIILQTQFNFVQLEKNKQIYGLKRVTASTNISMGYTHLLSSSALLQDDMVVESTLHGNGVKETREKFKSLAGSDMLKRGRVMVEKEMFPDNKKVEKEYNKIFGKEKE